MGQLSGKNILIVVGQTNYNEQEFNHLYQTLPEAGARVWVAAPRMEKALGRLEGYAVPDLTIEQARPEDYDAVVLVGGYGAFTDLWDNETLHQFLQQFHQTGKPIVACSVAPAVLAKAGILSGKKATTYPDYKAGVIFQNENVIHVYESVVEDDNIITTNHPREINQVVERLMTKLAGANG